MMDATANQRTDILCIDDDPNIIAGLTQMLMAAGHSCRCCGDRDSAMASLRDVAPDLVIVDINLGEASGLDLCDQMRQNEHLREVPVIFLSGAEIPNIVQRTRAVGGTYYLRKPYDAEVLLELVEKALWMPHVAKTQVATPHFAGVPMKGPAATGGPTTKGPTTKGPTIGSPMTGPTNTHQRHTL